MDRMTSGRAYKRTGGQADHRTGGWADGRTCAGAGGRTGARTEGQTGGRADRRTSERADGWTNCFTLLHLAWLQFLSAVGTARWREYASCLTNSSITSGSGHAQSKRNCIGCSDVCMYHIPCCTFAYRCVGEPLEILIGIAGSC